MDSFVCESPRLYLRKIVAEDADSLLQVLGDREVMRFSVHGPDNADGVRKFIESTQKRYLREGTAQWAVIEKQTGNLIGECGISVQLLDGQKEFEIGYRLNRKFWGKGFGSEAAMACRDYGFTKLNLNRLISIIEKENVASINVAKKIGMILEKESSFYDIPVEIYSITKTT